MSTTSSGSARAAHRPHRAAVLITLILAMLASVVSGLSAAPAQAASMSSGYGFTYYAGYLPAGQTQTYCWDYAGYQYHGAVVVTAQALEYNVDLQVSNTQVKLNYGQDWYYCADVKNLSATGSGVNIVQRTAVTFAYSESLSEGWIAGLSTQTYCFHYPNHNYGGAVVVSARGSGYGYALVTLHTSLEYRYGTGYVYCATISNPDGVGTYLTLDIGIGPQSTNYYDDYIGYLGPNSTTTRCWYMPVSSMPAVAVATGTSYNAELQTLSMSRTAVSSTSALYCATIANVSDRGTDATIHTRSNI